MQPTDRGDHQYHHYTRHQDRQHQQQRPTQDNQHDAPCTRTRNTSSSWGVTYLLQSAKRGWQRHKSPHVVSLHETSNCLDVTDAATSRLQEQVDLTGDTAAGAVEVAFVAAADEQNIVRFTLAGQPVRKFALITDSGRDATELCQALDRQGVSVRGIEDLPDAVFLRGGDQRTAQVLEAEIPNLSRPEVQAYIVRLLFQDSFHHFVADLSEMFSHVQTHLPAPPSTPAPTTQTSANISSATTTATATATSTACTSTFTPARREGNSSAGEDGGGGPRDGGQADRTIRCGGAGGADDGGAVDCDGAKSRTTRRGRNSVGNSDQEEEEGEGGSVAGVIQGSVSGGTRRRGGEDGHATGGRGAVGKGKARALANNGGGTAGRGRRAGRGRGGRGVREGARSGEKSADAGEILRCQQTSGDGGGGAAPDGRGGSNQISLGGSTTHSSSRVPPASSTHNKRPAVPAAAPGEGNADVTAKVPIQQGKAPFAKRPRIQQQQQQQRQRVKCGGGKTSDPSTTSTSGGGGRGYGGIISKVPTTRRRPVGEAAAAAAAAAATTTPTAGAGVGVGVGGAVIAAAPTASSRRAVKAGGGETMKPDTLGRDQPRKGKGVGGNASGNAGGRGQPTLMKNRSGNGNGYGNGNGNGKRNIRKKSKIAVAATAYAAATAVAAAASVPASTTEGIGKRAAVAASAEASRGEERTGRKLGPATLPMRPVTSSGRAPGLCKTLKNYWGKVNKHHSSWVFAKAVDLAKAPDYLDVVKHPVDLESIRKRLDGPTVHYNNEDMLHDDLVLMCRNAMLYNDEGTVYYRAAEDVLQFVESIFDR
ncbi:unnamed protein product [Pylaiella littoralis]